MSNTPKPNVRPGRAGRTPLFNALRRALSTAIVSTQSHNPPADELIEMRRGTGITRRDFLRSTATGALAIGAAGLWTSCASADRYPSATAPKVVIVGGGMAGLNAARRLRRGGLRADIYDGAKRTGGRMYTAHDLMGPNLTTELGGEFIDTNHADMFELIKELRLETYDLQSTTEKAVAPEAYFFNGRHYTDKELVQAFLPIAPRIKADFDSLGEVVDFEHEGGAKELDNTSLAQYLDRLGATGWLRKLLEVAFVTEYGLDAADQSSLNMLFMISTDVSHGRVDLLGESDERFKVRGGNQRIVDGLASRLADQIQLEHRLVRIKEQSPGYTLTFAGPNGTSREVNADFVILTIPFTLLRTVEVLVEMPDYKTRAIRDLGYGNCAKVMAGFAHRIWRTQGFSGNTYSDEAYQLAWDNTRMQLGQTGGLTFYSGGRAAIVAGEGTAAEQVQRLMPGIEKAYPGATAELNGRTGRFHWPSYEWTRGAYAAYHPGQWTTICGAEIKPVGNLLFAGEHCSTDFQGFMNGAAETGRITAEGLLRTLKKRRRVQSITTT